MNRTKLIQRVSCPRPNRSANVSPLAFGGGLHYGGLKPEARDLISSVFQIDYMGRAEFEWGALPDALRLISTYAAAGTLEMVTRTYVLKDILLEWKSLKRRQEENGTLYIIGNKSDMEEICRRMDLIIYDESSVSQGTRKYRDKDIALVEGTKLNYYLTCEPAYDYPIVGGLELDNGFFFTADESMAKKFLNIFVTSPQETAEEPPRR